MLQDTFYENVYFIYLFFLVILLRAVFSAENNLQTKIFLKIMFFFQALNSLEHVYVVSIQRKD